MSYRAAFIVLILVVGCTPIPKVSVCSSDAKLCPDGSAVGREGPDCHFPPCPELNCDYNAPSLDYKANSTVMCSQIKFSCPPEGTFFSDYCGCGCTKPYTPPLD